MTFSSTSDSDSDREPNSQGARVFWGNLKTPERSQANFINPPKTVVKNNKSQSHPRRKSASPSIQVQDDNINNLKEADLEDGCDDDNDETINPARLQKDLQRNIESNASAGAVEPIGLQQPVAEIIDTGLQAASPTIQPPPPQPLISTLNGMSSDLGSESEVEGDAVLEPSSSIDSLSDVEPHSSGLGRLCEPSPSPELRTHPSPTERSPPCVSGASEFQDLISFDITTSTRSSLYDSRLPSLPPSDSTPPDQPSSSNVTVDDLLTLSPQPIKSQPPSLLQITQPEQRSQDDSLTPISSSDRDPSADAQTKTNSQIGDGQPTSEIQAMSEAHVRLPGDGLAVQMPERVAGPLPPTSKAETCALAAEKTRKAKEKAEDSSRVSNELLINASDQSGRSSGDGTDEAIKKERKAKAKAEADRKRIQLLSLSPTSADVLNLLASPGRGSPPRSPGSEGPTTGFNFKFSTPQRKEPTAPGTSPRRLHITQSFQQRLEGLPPPFVRPNPVPLDDPTRTPAQRVPSTLAARPQPLPLDHPNRTPARRVAIPVTSPGPAESLKLPPPLEGSAVRSRSVSPVKPTVKPIVMIRPLNRPANTSSSTASRTARPLPFPIARQPGEGRRNADASESSSRPGATSSSAKPPSTSSLRQSSTTSTSKVARAASKPYSRPGYEGSRLPKPSSRIPITNAGGTNNCADLSGTNIPPAAPTRIPSPVKRHAPSLDPPEPAHAPSFSPMKPTATEDVTTTYRRKRQRMIAEDSDSDEPPAKRPVIMVRPVIKGMYNKAALADPPVVGSSTSQRDGSPMRPSRPPGPIQIRPVIPGTLGHFETTRSSSRNLMKNTEGGAQADGELASAPEALPLRSESPMIDTDTASTVTTISREPTLELPASSSPGGRHASPPTLVEPGPELRRTTRVRKPCGPDTSSVSGTITTSRRDPTTLTRTTSMVQRASASSKASFRSSTRNPNPLGYPTNPRQLQALTDANTARNQAYLADLQRKVVRRQGPRPASPTTKVRTIMEKSKEESSKDREARAERRRRRGEGSNVTTSSEGDYLDIPSSPQQDGQEPAGGALQKHVRGPGDEEDYETPIRQPKPSRSDPDKIVKNVKWDRGLARTISEWAAEQAAKQAKEREAAEFARKGCLARDPTTLQLDPFGNVPEANVPLDDLGRERVVVTRFVYDDDVEAPREAKKRKS